jgi:hypothetical protein
MKQSRFSTYKSYKTINRPLDPPRKTTGQAHVKINDRVTTPHGNGTVIEISLDRYLIALDGQLAQVWERLSSLKALA